MLRRKTSTPAPSSRSMTSASLEAGPRVATIFVRRRLSGSLAHGITAGSALSVEKSRPVCSLVIFLPPGDFFLTRSYACGGLDAILPGTTALSSWGHLDKREHWPILLP